MKIKIQRYNIDNTPNIHIQEFSLDGVKHVTLLQTLIEIKHNIDATLTFRSGCKSGVCGCCAVRVNGVEKLACKTKINDGDLVEPLNYVKVIKDLVTKSYASKKINQSKGFLSSSNQDIEVTKEDEKRIDRQSNCILCQSCYSSCPVFAVNENFIGPYALTKALRYVNDVKEENKKEKIDAIQTNGIWDCTLCGNCTLVCPEFIDPKTDIMNLRFKSNEFGYSDPNASMNFGFDPSGGFGGGFNPNF